MAKLKAGDPAPDFELSGTGGKTYRLSDYRGQKLILAFYPGDFTAVCTKQFCSYRDDGERLDNLGAQVLGISSQSVDSHERFAKEKSLNVPLLADEDKEVARAYGVVMGPMVRRATFIVDEEGVVRHAKVSLTSLGYDSVDDLEQALASNRLMAPEAEAFEVGPAPILQGEVEGEGPPVVLCHGITATRRYVLHGSRALARAGHRVLVYDARGHGASEAAPVGEGYGYPQLVEDLERVVADRLGEERFLLGGHSMGAHTAVAYALRHPERLAGLAVIGPTFLGAIKPESLEYWDGLAEALEADGVDGFVAYIGERQGIDSRWRESVLRFTRERMLRQENLDALAEALRQVPRSRPFDSLDELNRLDVPALVVASNDEADPGHPYAAAAAYAEAMPRAELISEGEGESPLAWQGGKLSRALAAFYAQALSSAR